MMCINLMFELTLLIYQKPLITCMMHNSNNIATFSNNLHYTIRLSICITSLFIIISSWNTIIIIVILLLGGLTPHLLFCVIIIITTLFISLKTISTNKVISITIFHNRPSSPNSNYPKPILNILTRKLTIPLFYLLLY